MQVLKISYFSESTALYFVNKIDIKSLIFLKIS